MLVRATISDILDFLTYSLVGKVSQGAESNGKIAGNYLRSIT